MKRFAALPCVRVRFVPWRRTLATESDALGANLLPLVNKLQSVFAMGKVAFDLPQLVVVGSQSSGKSSVIEQLVGKDFLPRGRGIVTRVPLVLQLVKSTDGPWAEFTHDTRFNQRRFDDFSTVKRTIEQETDRLAGKGKGVRNTPIVLRVHSPNTIPLTLVDTPGLTRVAISEQPADIEQQIRKMVASYIEQPNSIILAVSAANQDIATSDALRLARQYDPTGDRTIGVLTKLDIMDKGTDALDTLSGRLYPLRLGFVGVVCRSQADIDSGKSLEQALLDEQAFFMSSPEYRPVADVNGTRYLARKCNRLLTQHIRRVLPQLKTAISSQIRTLEAELVRIGDSAPPEDSTQRGYLLMRLITNFCNAFRSAIDGSVRLKSTSVASGDEAPAPSHQLNGGARIRHIFNDVFDAALYRIDPLEGLTDRDIQAAIRNAAGPKPAIFLPEAAFEMLVKRQIGKLLDPALQCVERVHAELVKIMLEMDGSDGTSSVGPGSGVVSQYAVLSDKIMESGQKMLRKTLSPTQELIRQVVLAESSYVNTAHRDFVGLQLLHDPAKFASSQKQNASFSSSSASSGDQQASQQSSGFFSRIFGSDSPAPSEPRAESRPQGRDITLPENVSERETFQINLLKTLLRSYFEVVRKNLQDITVKLVWRNVVERAKDDMQRQLMADLYRPDNFASLLQENPQIASQRVIYRERLAALRAAKAVIKEEANAANLD